MTIYPFRLMIEGDFETKEEADKLMARVVERANAQDFTIEQYNFEYMFNTDEDGKSRAFFVGFLDIVIVKYFISALNDLTEKYALFRYKEAEVWEWYHTKEPKIIRG